MTERNMALRFIRYTACVCLIAVLAGCASTGNEISTEKLNENMKISDTFAYSGEGEYGEKWWEIFNNSELNGLMEQMFENNYNIAGSYEGLKALQAALGISRADRLPSVDAGAQAGETYSTSSTGERKWREGYEISLTASYEADIWGRIKAATESDRLALVSGRYDVQTLYMTLTAELADRYFLYKSLASVLKMQREMLELRQKQISSLEMMYSSGIGSLDVIYTYQTNIADLMESMTETRQSMRDAKLQMALLMGYNDPAMVEISDKYNLDIPFLPKVIPSDVAEKRPDIRSAYALVLQADRNVAEAMANRYPKLSFSASAAYNGDELSNLVTPENFVANLIANLTMPLFDAGKLSNQQKQREFLYKQEVYSYYQTVLEALNEVSGSLEDNMQNEQALLLSQQKVSIEENRLQVSKMKYEMGILSYSDVIDDQIGLLSAWLTEVNARRSLISSRIELARSTGGSWTDEEIDNRLSSSQETK
jgi:NodT family efflux transporter outer membrane factor (OMF) lipoprotein